MPGRTLKRIQKEQESAYTIDCNTTCSISKIAQQETTCVPVAQVTDASVDLDSAATISDHDTTGLLECSAVCCSNEMEAYQPKQKDNIGKTYKTPSFLSGTT